VAGGHLAIELRTDFEASALRLHKGGSGGLSWSAIILMETGTEAMVIACKCFRQIFGAKNLGLSHEALDAFCFYRTLHPTEHVLGQLDPALFQRTHPKRYDSIMNKPLSLAAASALLLSLLCVAAGPPVANEARFPGGKLSNGGGASEFEMRGYGRVSSLDRRADDGKASLLERDMRGRGTGKTPAGQYSPICRSHRWVRSVDVPASGRVLKAWEVEGQGMICALSLWQEGLPGCGEGGCRVGRNDRGVNVPERSMEAEVEVPMWLNRWDRFRLPPLLPPMGTASENAGKGL